MRGESGYLQGKALKTEKVNGRNLQIFVSDSGTFYAEWDPGQGEFIRGNSMKELLAKLREATRKRGVKIPVTVIHDTDHWDRKLIADEKWRFIDGTLTGIHATRRQNALIRDDEDASAISIEYNDLVSRRLTAEEKQQFLDLADAATKARLAFESFREAIVINPELEVERAVNAKETPKVDDQPGRPDQA